MNTTLISKIEQTNLRHDLPNFKVGDTVNVHTIIREGNKQRIQQFKGLVVAINGSGTRQMFTARKISYGVGVEKVFPLYSTNIAKIEVLKHGKVRRSKIYYMRDRIGKLAMKIKPGEPAPVIEHAELAQTEIVDDQIVSDAVVEEAVVEGESIAQETEEVGTDEVETVEEVQPAAEEEEEKTTAVNE